MKKTQIMANSLSGRLYRSVLSNTKHSQIPMRFSTDIFDFSDSDSDSDVDSLSDSDSLLNSDLPPETEQVAEPEWMKKIHLQDAVSIKSTQIANQLSLPPAKLYCGKLAEDATKAAMSDYQAKRAKYIYSNL